MQFIKLWWSSDVNLWKAEKPKDVCLGLSAYIWTRTQGYEATKFKYILPL